MRRSERVAAVVARVRARIDRGETVDFEAQVRGHADIAPQLRRAFATLRDLDGAFAGRTDPGALPSLVGRTLATYRIESVLGSGGMGVVYRAVATGGSGPVALKVVHPHLLQRPGYFERFLREAEVGRRIRHENVVATLDAGEAVLDDGALVRFLVMEHVEGRTLRSLASELGRVPEELCRHVGREVAKGLTAIHAAGAVHRDLKPDNVLITHDHVVKVMDLGVARLLDDEAHLSQTGAFVGSVRYGAPEQFGLPRAAGAQEATPRSPARAKGGHHVDGRADLYALGLTLFEMATGRHPFEGDDLRVVVRQQMSETPPAAGTLNPQISPFFEDVLRRLLEKEPHARFESAVALLEALSDGEESAWWRKRSQAIRSATHRPLRRIRIPRETALYGRDAELALLRSLFQRASEGDGQVAVIEGEAGIGKSRLVDEFVGQLAQAGEDVNFLFGSYPPGGAATASGAFSTAYREHLGDDEVAIRAALPQTPLLVPAFAALLRGDVAPDDAEKLTKDSLQTVFVHATRAFAAERPTIVLIDDLHFAPEEGRALFASLALAVPGHRVLLVGCARPTLDEKWLGQIGRLGHATRLALPRLGAKDLVLLLRDSLGSEHLAEELGAKIALKSDGNPFFVFEILRGLREGQFITKRSDGTWATTREIREIQVPSSIVELVQARVSDLSRTDRNVLEVASCAGFEFDAALVGDVLKLERIPLLQTLGAIEKSHRLVHSAGRRFVFDHHQVMEVLYAGLSAPLREEYHAAIGAAIEARSGAVSREADDLDGAVCVEIAEHLLKGAQGARALRYLDAALTHLERSYLNDATVRLAERALAAPALVAGKVRAELLLHLCDTNGPLERLGRYARAEEAAQEAERLAEAASAEDLRGEAARARGAVLLSTSRYAEAEACFRRQIDVARTLGDRKAEAVATDFLGQALFHTGRPAEALEQFERSLATSREIGHRHGEATGAGNLGVVYKHQGRLAEAREQYERCLSLSREIGDRQGEAAATGNLGVLLSGHGRLADARAHFELYLAMTREIGNRHSEANAIGQLAMVLLQEGRLAEASERAERFVALSSEFGDRYVEAFAHMYLGTVLQIQGRLARAREHYDRCLTTSLDIGHRRGEVGGRIKLSVVALALGDRDRARATLLDALRICRDIGDRDGEGQALLRLASVADEEGDAAAALERTNEALALLRAIDSADAVLDCLTELGDLCRRTGDVETARAALEEAATLARAQGRSPKLAVALAILACLPAADATAAFAALPEAGDNLHGRRVRFLLWQATRDPGHLIEAKRLLDFLVEHAPPECREPMITNVRLHREIAAAARK